MSGGLCAAQGIMALRDRGLVSALRPRASASLLKVEHAFSSVLVFEFHPRFEELISGSSWGGQDSHDLPCPDKQLP